MTFHVTSIPHAMRVRGWFKGAQLLDRWFSLPPTVKPMYGPPDLTTIGMDSFILRYSRARAVFDRLVAPSSWSSPAALRELERVLARQGLFSGPGLRTFGEESVSTDVLHRDHITHLAFDDVDYGAPRDDLTAALHDFSFYLAASGTITPYPPTHSGATHRVEITGLAVWAHDSFDFEGFQPLGEWDIDHALLATSVGDIEVHHVGHYTTVTNATFREWRAANGRGGDFLVFSDVKRVPLSPPFVSFDVTA